MHDDSLARYTNDVPENWFESGILTAYGLRPTDYVLTFLAFPFGVDPDPDSDFRLFSISSL